MYWRIRHMLRGVCDSRTRYQPGWSGHDLLQPPGNLTPVAIDDDAPIGSDQFMLENEVRWYFLCKWMKGVSGGHRRETCMGVADVGS